VTAPVEVVVAVSCRVDPLHNGVLAIPVGAAGGFGSVSTNGPTLLDTQLLSDTVMSE